MLTGSLSNRISLVHLSRWKSGQFPNFNRTNKERISLLSMDNLKSLVGASDYITPLRQQYTVNIYTPGIYALYTANWMISCYLPFRPPIAPRSSKTKYSTTVTKLDPRSLGWSFFTFPTGHLFTIPKEVSLNYQG